MLGAFALGLAVGLPTASEAADSSCVSLSSRNSRSEIAEFKRDPARHLLYLRGDTSKIKGFISSYIASDPDLLVPLRQFIARANSDERIAVGVGLANAAERCMHTQPIVNADIAKYVSKLGDPNVSAGFLSQSPAKSVELQTSVRSRPAGGRKLIEGEDGDKLVDPFAAVPLPE